MSKIWGYSDFLKLLNERSRLREGLVVDTNVLIAATYDLDLFHDVTIDFLDLVFENEVPLFCNVNVRAEFLDIHRRIIFTEAILDFERAVNKKLIPTTLAKKLNSWRTSAEKKKKQGSTPLRLNDRELKDIKLEMMQIKSDGTDLWTEVCENRIANKLSDIWNTTSEKFGLNFLSTRKEDSERNLEKNPSWDETAQMMEKHGLGSSDAMIINIFLCSRYEALVSSDKDIGIGIAKLKHKKICILPDEEKIKVNNLIR